jgi:hypothetical protein
VPKLFVNLDALIPRKDFEEADPEDQTGRTNWPALRLSDLDPDRGINYSSFYKPDFQRETASWTPETITGFIESFVKGDFLPSVIMWRNPKTGNFFIIDGAHRLSALKAWVLDDYGDRVMSLDFFENLIPSDQIEAAEKTRQLVNDTVGAWDILRKATRFPENSDPVLVQRGKDADASNVPIHWVEGEPKRAEQSFYQINLQAVPIDPTEAHLIQARRKPSAIAARAIIRRSAGHQYWDEFEKKDDIKDKAKAIYDILYVPEMERGKLTTIDLPIAGRSYAGGDSLSLTHNVGAITNGMADLLKKLKHISRNPVYRQVKKKKDVVEEPDDDKSGQATLKYLTNTYEVVRRISGQDDASLGLHPAVYFYGITGRFQPTAFLATIKLIMDIEKRRGFIEFTKRRARFEEFLLQHRYFTNQIVNKFGGQLKSYERLFDYYSEVLEMIDDGMSFDEIKNALLKKRQFLYLKDHTGQLTTTTSKFSSAVNTVAFLRQAIQGAIICEICHARINSRSISHDHRVERIKNGTGDADNNALVHFFCNTGYKTSGAPPIPPLAGDL